LILSIYFISSSLNKIVKFKQKNILAYVISFVILLISTFLFKDGIKVNEWVNNYYIYLLSLGILLPMTITFIGVMVDKFKGYINKDV
jgi:hypothetical protein